jgi:GT2 family glycosyltransferase
LLAKCLQRLQPGIQTLDAALYEVIVSDDSTHNEAEALIQQQFRWVKYIHGPKRGPASNRNNGARLAAGQWLVFTDDDCLPDANWLQAYVDAVEQHPKCRAFEGSILPNDWALLKKDMAECPVNTTGGCFWSANIMVEKKLYGEVGGFDEQFTIAAQEDQDLQNMLLSKTVISFVPAAQVEHAVRQQPFFFAEKNKWIRLKSYVYKSKKQGMTALAIFRKSVRGVMAASFASFKKKHVKQGVHLSLHLLYQMLALPAILLSQNFTQNQSTTNHQ